MKIGHGDEDLSIHLTGKLRETYLIASHFRRPQALDQSYHGKRHVGDQGQAPKRGSRPGMRNPSPVTSSAAKKETVVRNSTVIQVMPAVSLIPAAVPELPWPYRPRKKTRQRTAPEPTGTHPGTCRFTVGTESARQKTYTCIMATSGMRIPPSMTGECMMMPARESRGPARSCLSGWTGSGFGYGVNNEVRATLGTLIIADALERYFLEIMTFRVLRK